MASSCKTGRQAVVPPAVQSVRTALVCLESGGQTHSSSLAADAFSEQRNSSDDQGSTAPTSHEKAPAGTEADVDEDDELLEEPPTTADCIVVRSASRLSSCIA